MKYLRQLKPNQLKNKTCLLRVDLNIETPEKESFRIQAILPTIKFLIDSGARIVFLSHRGRPIKTNSQQPTTDSYSLKPFAEIISKLTKKPVHFVDCAEFSDWQKGDLKNKIVDSGDEIILLDNLRFFAEEEKNDDKFAGFLASLGEIYINDAFAVSHRENASVAAITKFLPSYCGLLLEKEIENLDGVTKECKKPLAIILGGAKISDKIGLINNFWEKADYFLIGGAMANTFFVSQGLPVGDSFYEKTPIDEKIMGEMGRKVILPVDTVISGKRILDIGKETVRRYGEIIKRAGTIIWNGPMGLFEKKDFAAGTEEISKAVLKNKKAKVVIGGGETITSLDLTAGKLRLMAKNKNLFLSTGGGAMLDYLAGKKLPGIAALEE